MTFSCYLQLFHFDVHEDVRTIADASLQQQRKIRQVCLDSMPSLLSESLESSITIMHSIGHFLITCLLEKSGCTVTFSSAANFL